MDKLVIGIIIVILLVGATFWVFNNDSGINKGIENGGKSVYTKTTKFDYSGTSAPGTANHGTEWVATP
ncbi:hypothetical protein ACFPOG_12615 [Paenibacillus aestuarii]|uniref:Uncharacterized protein n=1 Tax=Paenibacillus aestuarii TaxID=516965 RepID=A0ABW0K8I9_9BACL